MSTLTKISPSQDNGENFHGRTEKSIEEMYDSDDLSACSLFTGNFINFGYWAPNPQNELISIAQRTESQKNLYRVVAKTLQISENDKLLEVACGQGVGASLILEEFHPLKINGIDLSMAQIERALKINSKTILNHLDKLEFCQGSSTSIPFPDESINKLFSIEAIQHFDNISKFAYEIFRVLKPHGKFAIAGFFGLSSSSEEKVSSLVQTVKDNIDRLHPISDFKCYLKSLGFKNVRIKNIGQNVWHGYDTWTSQQTEFKDSWTRNWKVAFLNGDIDYYIISGEKE